jgi:HSP20 family molecular chaperone IbpA
MDDNRDDMSVRESVESDKFSEACTSKTTQSDFLQGHLSQGHLSTNEIAQKQSPISHHETWSELDRNIEKYWQNLLYYAGELMWTPPTPPSSWFNHLADTAEDLFEMKVYDEPSRMVIQLFVPHMPEDQVQMYVYRDGLLLAVEDKESSELRHDNGSIIQKRSRSTYMRRFIPFTAPVIYDNISSTFDNGCLNITIPKRNDSHTSV